MRFASALATSRPEQGSSGPKVWLPSLCFSIARTKYCIGGLPAWLPAPAAKASATAAVAAAAPAAIFLGTSFVHLNRAPAEFLSVQPFDGLLSIRLVRHFDERKPTRLPGIAVTY